jgi:hypothetical protein
LSRVFLSLELRDWDSYLMRSAFLFEAILNNKSINRLSGNEPGYFNRGIALPIAFFSPTQRNE